MRFAILLCVFSILSCGDDRPPPEPQPVPVPSRAHAPEPEPFCGDGVCDEWRGEDAWWCPDCGFDPATGGPRDGGYCGDGHCFGDEDELTCWTDCRPKPFRPTNPRDPGWIDPIPGRMR